MPFLPWTGLVPVAAVGAEPVVPGVFVPGEALLSSLVPPRLAKAMAAMRRTTTPVIVTREREFRTGRRAWGWPASPSGRRVRVCRVPPRVLYGSSARPPWSLPR